MHITRIFALGSPHGDDRAGWQCAERLRARLEDRVLVVPLAAPLELLDQMAGCERMVVLDACRTGAPPGTLVRLEWPDPRIASAGFASTHQLGLADVLRLAETLQRLPRRVILFGVELRRAEPGQTALSQAVERGLPLLERLVLEELSTHQ